MGHPASFYNSRDIQNFAPFFLKKCPRTVHFGPPGECIWPAVSSRIPFCLPGQFACGRSFVTKNTPRPPLARRARSCAKLPAAIMTRQDTYMFTLYYIHPCSRIYTYMICRRTFKRCRIYIFAPCHTVKYREEQGERRKKREDYSMC